MRLFVRVTAPVPRFRSFVPVKMLFPPQLMGLLFVSVIGAPDVLSRVMPFITTGLLDPNAVALFTLIVPLLSVVMPLYVFVPESVSTPVPL